MAKSWYRIQAKADGEAEIWLYDEIGYWGISASQFVDELRVVDAESITLHLNSPGGEVFDGIAIYNSLKDHPATVNVKIEGLAASITSVISQAGDKISIAKTASIMIHEAHGFAMGNSQDMRKLADELDMVGETISEIYADRAGGEASEWRERMAAESWYRGQAAVDIGLADEVEGAAKNAAPLRIFNLAKFKNVPPYVPQRRESLPRNAGRTMSQTNLDKMHDALDGLLAVHDGTCDMGGDCPMSDSAATDSADSKDSSSIAARLRASIDAAQKEAVRA